MLSTYSNQSELKQDDEDYDDEISEVDNKSDLFKRE